MSEKVVVLVEDDLSKMEDMLLSIQSILFVAVKQQLANAPGENDTEICLVHVIGKDEKEDSKTFDGFRATLEERQRKLMDNNHGCKLKYRYEAVHIDKESYPVENMAEAECKKSICQKIEEITRDKDYSIVLDVILNNDKDLSCVLDKKIILSQALYQEYSAEHCIPYTKYDTPTKKFRKMWAEALGCELPLERFCLDGNVIHKDFKQKIYGQLHIGV